MKLPKLRRNGDGRAFVQVARRRFYLGKFGTPEAENRYTEFIARHAAGLTALVMKPVGGSSVNCLVVRFLRWAETYYAGSREYENCLHAVALLVEMFGHEPVLTFGPLKLVALQERMVAAGYRRGVINIRIRKVRRVFKWGAKMELIPAAIFQALTSVEGVREGRQGVVESVQVKPVAWSVVEATLPHLSPVVRAMVWVQYLCGMRPGETTRMRPCDIDTSGPIWLYRPARHKRKHLGQETIKAVPVAAQRHLAAFLNRPADAYLFSPKESSAWHRMRKADPHRKTNRYPSEAKRVAEQKARALRRVGGERRPGEQFTVKSYYRAIDRAIRQARKSDPSLPHWHPHQLRHSIATEISRTMGQQKAQRWLSHADLDTTKIYTEVEIAELIEIAQALDARWAG